MQKYDQQEPAVDLNIIAQSREYINELNQALVINSDKTNIFSLEEGLQLRNKLTDIELQKHQQVSELLMALHNIYYSCPD